MCVCHNVKFLSVPIIVCVKSCIIIYMYYTYSDSLSCSLSAVQCAGGGYHVNGVGGPCNQSSDGGSSGSSLGTL